jgi:orotate phosphoribosyltransferase
MIEGEIRSGDRLLVVEDLISTGGSCLAAVEALQAVGYQVAGVLAIFSYGFPHAQAAFEKANCSFDTLSSYPVLLEEAKRQDYIDAEQLSILQKWQNDPKGWSEQFGN